MAWLEPITSAVLIYGAKSDHLQRLKADPPPHPTNLTDRASRIIALSRFAILRSPKYHRLANAIESGCVMSCDVLA